MMAESPGRFAVVTNIPTPYRTAFFDAVAEVCRSRGAAFKVFYCATIEKNRNWPFEPSRLGHEFEILPGLHLTLGGADHHVNPSVIPRLAAWRPATVLCAGAWHMFATVLTAVAQSGGGFRTVFWSEGHAGTVRHASGMITWLRRSALRLHHAYAVPNRRSAAWIRAHVPDARILLLPNTVDGAFFSRRSADERAKARMALGVAADETVILQVSQLTVRKGVIALAQAFCALPYGATSAARLVFVGAGPLEWDLRRIAALSAGRVVVAGSADVDGVRTWLMAADWFALNSTLDPNPLSPIEASFGALPLLLTRRAGNFDELLSPGKTGWEIVDPADPSPALMQALTAPSGQAAKMGKAAFENVRANFDINAVANDLIDQLADILKVDDQPLLRCAE
jgi:glycosyltransferase involved in cell wall biosynthesis